MGWNRKKLAGRLSARFFVLMQSWLEKKDPIRAERIGARLGRMIYRLSKKHRERTKANLRLAFPEKPDDEIQSLSVKVFEHFGMMGTDFLRSRKRSNQEVLDSIEMEGFEHVEQALALGKGVIVITAHFGNWERVGHYASAKGYKMHVVARDADDSVLNERVGELRAAAGIEVMSRGDAARQILRKLRDKQMVAILPDQNSEEIFVPFFGHPCGTVLGPAVLHERTGAPVVPAYCARVGPARYRLVIEPPLEPVEGFERNEGMTRAINNSLERIIRQYPEQYLWLHDRWKSARRRGLL